MTPGRSLAGLACEYIPREYECTVLIARDNRVASGRAETCLLESDRKGIHAIVQLYHLGHHLLRWTARVRLLAGPIGPLAYSTTIADPRDEVLTRTVALVVIKLDTLTKKS